MSDNRSGGGFFVAGVLALGFIGFAVAGGGSSQPEKCDKPAPQSCYDVATTLVPPPDTVPGTDATPPPSVNPNADSSVFAPSSTAMPVIDTGAPRPNSEAAPKPTEAAPTEPPATEPPATDPLPAGIDWDACERIATVQVGDNSWSLLADRLDVWTADLLARNQATKDTPLLVGARICAPPSVYGDNAPAPATTTGTTTTTTTTTAPPTTQAPQAPPTQAPTTTEQRRSPGGQRTTTSSTIEPVWVAPTTAAPKQPQAPPKQPQQPPSPGTVRPGPGTVRTTAPPCAGC